MRLEVQVTGSYLRYRTSRAGAWREIPLSAVLAADRRAVAQRSWPVAYRAALDGTEAYVTLSGQGVLLTLQGGRRLLLGTRQPEAMIQAVQSCIDPIR